MSKGINGSPKTTTLKKKEWTKGTPSKPGVGIEFTLKKNTIQAIKNQKLKKTKTQWPKHFITVHKH